MEFDNIFIEKAGDRRKAFELGFLLDQWNAQEIATELGISTIIVREHMKRNIPLDVREELTQYLPSTAAQCAELLIKVKNKSLDLLAKSEMEDREIRLLSTLVQSTSKFLEKYGQLTEGVAGVNAPVQSNAFERACLDVLVEYPDVFLKIKERMIEYGDC